jgi:hypothetical protein
MAKKFINPCVLSLMQTQKLQVAAAEAAGARGAPGSRRPPEWYAIVVYEKKRIKTVVLYAGRETFAFKVPAHVSIGDAVIMKRWQVGAAKAYSARIHAVNLVKLINAYAYNEARLRISLFDPIYRAAALSGYKVHDNELYVKLWLEHELGEELFRAGDPRERELGGCIRAFTHSYGIWRMVTPPWAAATC